MMKLNLDKIAIEGMLHAIEDLEYNLQAQGDEKTKSQAITYNIMIIGEASKKLSEPYKQQHSNIPWRKISDMRNRLIHDYQNVSMERIHEVTKQEIPELKNKLNTLHKAFHDS